MTDSGKLSVLHMVTTGLSIVDDNIEDGTYNSKIRALAALGSVVSHERAAILEALKEKAERDNPKPLSAEELKELDGEPAWAVEIGDAVDDGYWVLVDVTYGGGIKIVISDMCIVEYYETDYNLYRHKPKTETEKG